MTVSRVRSGQCLNILLAKTSLFLVYQKVGCVLKQEVVMDSEFGKRPGFADARPNHSRMEWSTIRRIKQQCVDMFLSNRLIVSS